MKRLKFNRVLTNKDFIYAITLLLIIGLISFSFYELSKAEVKVTQGDEVTTIRTHANTVGGCIE
ncbi:hypothetical protein JCM21714_3305 [Gracilibacillus boraciitolerans JCM 21714]|uniref:Uncharacterized protein n=1 Tax=Gracilibacillus boraciitolerans JCM 21714 TaxID=1298598 RepID=W4VN41_9BACI|nr:hypothetical protein [Gracilibacillus boraciitolerans]GAE94169.1 hypothetical protein JCM21714_3305 [Gracilibacillus boraciitolerans JCM 21714]